MHVSEIWTSWHPSPLDGNVYCKHTATRANCITNGSTHGYRVRVSCAAYSKFQQIWQESARCVARVFAHHNHRQKSYLQPWPEHPFRSRKKSNLNRKVELTAWTRSWATCERFPVLVSVPATNPGAVSVKSQPCYIELKTASTNERANWITTAWPTER